MSIKTLDGIQFRVRWKSGSVGVRQFVVLVDGDAKERVNPTKRFATVTTDYGSHCVRVQAMAKAVSGSGYKDSAPTGCKSVTFEKPEPEQGGDPIVGTWQSGGYPITFDSDGTYRMGNQRGTWTHDAGAFNGWQYEYAMDGGAGAHMSVYGDSMKVCFDDGCGTYHRE